jgi:hypothetical protein
MTSVTFDGITLKEPWVQPQIKPRVNETELVSGKIKLTVSSGLKTSWQISFITESEAEYTAILAKIGVIGSLIIDGVTKTKCAIKTWGKEKDINPSTRELSLLFVQDTT